MPDTTAKTSNPSICGHCRNPLSACTCTEASMRCEACEKPSLCHVCGLAIAFDGFDDCVACAAAYLIHEDPEQLSMIRRINVGTPWLAQLNAEVARQLGQPVNAGVAVAA